mmetsp:Transcript_81479/g.242852  ORF Transcript_81479/g.242852 Transcript_81479/m.242852 type:complete len:223 (-) Transcript_81479:53-721(-)
MARLSSIVWPAAAARKLAMALSRFGSVPLSGTAGAVPAAGFASKSSNWAPTPPGGAPEEPDEPPCPQEFMAKFEGPLLPLLDSEPMPHKRPPRKTPPPGLPFEGPPCRQPPCQLLPPPPGAPPIQLRGGSVSQPSGCGPFGGGGTGPSIVPPSGGHAAEAPIPMQPGPPMVLGPPMQPGPPMAPSPPMAPGTTMAPGPPMAAGAPMAPGPPMAPGMPLMVPG